MASSQIAVCRLLISRITGHLGAGIKSPRRLAVFAAPGDWVVVDAPKEAAPGTVAEVKVQRRQ
jgi:hypothetical protein